MAGEITAGGLITGLDTNQLIASLIQFERQPILRFQDRIGQLETQQRTLRELRTQLLALRNRTQDFRFSNVFNAFSSSSSEETVLAASVTGSNPVVGAFEINVTALASATNATSSNKLGATIDPDAALEDSGIYGGVTEGTFTINGIEFTVDPTTQSLNDILGAINGSAAGVTATYNATTDTVTVENSTPGDTAVINFGGPEDDSNFLTALSLTTATQATGGNGATTATSTRNLGAVDSTELLNGVSFRDGAVTAGAFSINGVSISVDPTEDTLLDVIQRINGSAAQVTASYDSSSDTIRVVSNTLGSRTVRFGGAGDTSNFLGVVNLDNAVQTAGNDAAFTINNGPVLTRNSNEISDAISGVTLNLRSTGASTVTVSSDNDSIVEAVEEFITEFNNSVNQLRDLARTGGLLQGDGGIRNIESFLRSNIFNKVSGLSDLETLLDIGISTGNDFDSTASANLSLNEEKFRDALLDNRQDVEALFSNEDGTGIADVIFGYLDEITRSTGYLNERTKSNGTISQQIQSLNDQIDRLEDRVLQKETRLRRQFTRLEQLSAGFQNQNSALSGLAFRLF